MLRTLLKPLSFVPALILMYMIFSFSAQPGDVSSQLSYKVSVKIVETADYIFDANLDYYQIDEWANKINFITRKLAHMTEYFALAIAVSFPLYVYGMHGILLMLVAGLICVGFACGDEYHQSFVMGRSPSTKDICIDSVGVFFGIIVVRIIGWTGRKTIFKPKKEKKKKLFKRNGKDTGYVEYEDPGQYQSQNGGYYQNQPQNGPGYYQNQPQGAPGYYQNQPQNGTGFYQNQPQGAPGYYQNQPQGAPGYYQNQPQGAPGYYQNQPQGAPGYYQNQPQGAPGYYQNQPQGAPGYYQNQPQGAPGYYQNQPQGAPGYYQNQPPGTATPSGTSRPTNDPTDPYWEPEKEIDFNLKPEYPEREYQEENDPYDNDWGFDDGRPLPHYPDTAAEADRFAPNVNTGRNTNVAPDHTSPGNVPEGNPAPPHKKKKKHEKDWFFDL